MHAVPVERVTPVLRWHAQRRHMAWLTPTTEAGGAIGWREKEIMMWGRRASAKSIEAASRWPHRSRSWWAKVDDPQADLVRGSQSGASSELILDGDNDP